MAKNCVLLSGPTISHDEKLKKELEEFAVVLTSDDNSQIESILRENKVDLIILEMSNANLHEIEVIKIVKTKFPNTEIILVDGGANQEIVAQAFAFGVKDAFRKPYKTSLIVERANALLRLTRFLS
jgi:DNA-binding NarL/FixJ family response regulator